MKQYTVKVYTDRTEWCNQKGKRHREGGLPAIEWSDGYKAYYVNGQLHRDDGLPAVEWADGTKEYWINGKQITKDIAEQLAKPSCNGKVVEIDGRKYQLKEIK